MNANKLSINVDKTFSMLFFNRQHDITDVQVVLAGVNDPSRESGKFLGMMIDRSLRFDVHVSVLCRKLSKTAGIFNRLKNILLTDILIKLYYSLIYPYFLYCISVWSGTHAVHFHSLMLIQKIINRNINNETYLAHTCPLLKTSNILKLQDVRTFLLAQHVFKNRNIFITYNDAHIYSTRQTNNLVPLFQRLSVSQPYITFAEPSTWNQLLDDLMECGSFFVFKRRLKQFLLAQFDGVD